MKKILFILANILSSYIVWKLFCNTDCWNFTIAYIGGGVVGMVNIILTDNLFNK